MFQTTAVSPTLVLLFALGLRAEESPRRITALAAEYDRHDSIVWFTLPKGASQLQYLEDERGERLVFQTDDPGQACYLEKDLKRGSQKTYRMVAAASSSVARGVEVARKNRQIELAIGGQVALCYQAEPGELPRPDIAPIYKRGGYLHPVFTPSGKLLTDDYATNHLHHHGIWFSWARVEFEGRQPDFWNMGDAKGRPNLSGLKGAGVAPCTAVFKANIATLTSPCRTIKSRLTKLGG